METETRCYHLWADGLRSAPSLPTAHPRARCAQSHRWQAGGRRAQGLVQRARLTCRRTKTVPTDKLQPLWRGGTGRLLQSIGRAPVQDDHG